MHAMANLQSNRNSTLSSFHLTLLLAVGLAFLGTSQALETIDLYTVSLPAESDEPSERQQIARKGLELVYRRASGDRNVLQSSPALRQYLGKAESYLQTFRYARRGGSTDSSPLEAYLSFSPISIKQHLRETGTPFWQENRPLVTVLMLVNAAESGSSTVVGAQAPISANQVLLQAKQIGLPVKLVKATSLQPGNELWSQSNAQLIDMLRTRNAKAILVGKLQQVNQSTWRSNWAFEGEGLQRDTSGNASSASETIAQGLALAQKTLAQRLANRLQPAANSQGLASRQRLEIEGIDSIEQYFALKKALAGLPSLEQYQVLQFSAGVVTLELRTQMSLASIARTLGQSGKLTPMPSGQNSVYRWSGS